MEEYKFGDWRSGEKQRAEVSLNVRQAAPTEYPIIIEREDRTQHHVENTMTTLLPSLDITTEATTEVLVTTQTSPDLGRTPANDDNNTSEERDRKTLSAVVQDEVEKIIHYNYTLSLNDGLIARILKHDCGSLSQCRNTDSRHRCGGHFLEKTVQGDHLQRTRSGQLGGGGPRGGGDRGRGDHHVRSHEEGD